MARILIVGAGDVGGRLARRLAAQGHAVFALRRQPQPLPGVTTLAADVTRPETLGCLPPALDQVVFALSAGAGGPAAYQAVYVDGTRHVLAALAGQSLRRVLWVSSTGVYGQSAGEAVDEETPAHPATATGHKLLAAEAAARAAGWPVTVVRLGGLYGPDRHRLLRWVQAGRPVQRVPPQWSNRIHVEDAAALLAHLLTRCAQGLPVQALYHGVDAAPVPLATVLDWLAGQLGLPLPPAADTTAGQGKRILARHAAAEGFRLHYPDYRAGYADVLSHIQPGEFAAS